MRNQPLTGYVLHQKPHGESRSLIYFFTQEWGVVHGIGKKNLPLFMPIALFATGKNSLKTFSQSQVITFNTSLTGQGLFAGLYLNEILLKLLPVEEPLGELWLGYQGTIQQISQLFQTSTTDDLTLLKWQLRQFETLLFDELGYGLDFSVDSFGLSYQAEQVYRYQLQQGFVDLLALDKADFVVTGEQIQQWQACLQDTAIFEQSLANTPQSTTHVLNQMGGIYRNILDNLLNYQQLQSRELWRQFLQYQ
ncbi:MULTISPECIES: DNA repair protein RecO [unclassified Moraxella]|uniref:DNA repair protein RecO n=1 Tax=unclassified Moraxella TaxID=2685852 RepID=UPI003AF474A3